MEQTSIETTKKNHLDGWFVEKIPLKWMIWGYPKMIQNGWFVRKSVVKPTTSTTAWLDLCPNDRCSCSSDSIYFILLRTYDDLWSAPVDFAERKSLDMSRGKCDKWNAFPSETNAWTCMNCMFNIAPWTNRLSEQCDVSIGNTAYTVAWSGQWKWISYQDSLHGLHVATVWGTTNATSQCAITSITMLYRYDYTGNDMQSNIIKYSTSGQSQWQQHIITIMENNREDIW